LCELSTIPHVSDYTTVPGTFYPFEPEDTENDRSDDGISPVIFLQQQFIFFGLAYNQVYVRKSDFILPWHSQ